MGDFFGSVVLYNNLWSSTLMLDNMKEEIVCVGLHSSWRTGIDCWSSAGIFTIARKYMMDYLKKNPPINEQMLENDDDANGYETIPKEN